MNRNDPMILIAVLLFLGELYRIVKKDRKNLAKSCGITYDRIGRILIDYLGKVQLLSS